MRETRSSGSVEGVMGNHDNYSDSTLPVEQDQEFQRSEYHQEASEHQRVNLLYPGPCRAQPTLSILLLDTSGAGTTIRENGPKSANFKPLHG